MAQSGKKRGRPRIHAIGIRETNRERMFEVLSNSECVDCGNKDPLVLEFDHLSDKTSGIGEMLAARTWAAIEAEMAKCQVLCANCHRRRTAVRGGHYRARMSGLTADDLP